MKLSISRCSKCSRIRLVDKVNGEKWVCFACKQKYRHELKAEKDKRLMAG
ncbi:MAG: hypothetical protein HZB67_04740 [Candidatus Aenigmarchaeota archaeon]|nr:hypothetical protein [Candidatus Aenigmarchaeota archaeon]